MDRAHFVGLLATWAGTAIATLSRQFRAEAASEGCLGRYAAPLGRMWIPVVVLVLLGLSGCGPAVAASTGTVGPASQQTMTAEDVQRISPGGAKALLDNGQAVLYDARSTESYRAGHAAGAISFPEADEAARLGELPADKALIFY